MKVEDGYCETPVLSLYPAPSWWHEAEFGPYVWSSGRKSDDGCVIPWICTKGVDTYYNVPPTAKIVLCVSKKPVANATRSVCPKILSPALTDLYDAVGILPIDSVWWWVEIVEDTE